MLVNFIASMFLAYLLGSIPSGLILARTFAKRDVRNIGSGHTGALNTMRAAGIFAGAFTLLADAAKAVVAIQFARAATGSEWGAALAGVITVIGHCWPVYMRFRGGMGLAPSIGSLFVLDLPALIALVVFWFPLKYTLHSSPRASVGVALLLPLVIFLTRAEGPLIAFGCGVAMVISLRHFPEWNH